MAENKPNRLAVLGCGAMGQALAKGMVNAGVLKPGEVVCVDIDQAKVNGVAQEFGIKASTSNTEAVKSADTIIIAVKPYLVGTVLSEIAPVLTKDQLVISIAAGVTLETLELSLPEGIPVIRCMPNTPALVGEGASGISLGSCATPEHAETAKRLLGAVGKVVEVSDKLMNAVTGLSGSGPAYVYMMIEAMAGAGVNVGLPRDAALLLAAQTVMGAAKMVIETGKHPAELKDLVTTPGGTTTAGLAEMEKGAFRSIMFDCVKAATLRSEELSKPE